MNNKRIIAGGLLAGLVMNIGETILNVPVIGAEFDAALQRLGVPSVGGAEIGMFVVMMFLLGIVSVWLYAALRPRLGAGPGTAIITGVVVWLLAFAFPTIGMMTMGFFPTGIMLIALVWQAVEVPLGVLAGAWIYREEPAAAPAAQYA